MKNKITLAILAAVLVFQAGAVAARADEISIGVGSGLNIIPFQDVYEGKIYQQIWSRAAFPQGKLEIDDLAFTSSGGGSTATFNVIVRMAVVQSASANFALNLGNNSQVVVNGVVQAVMTGKPGDLSFSFRGKPFIYDTSQGDLLVQIEVVDSANAPIGFLFEAPSSLMWRVYENLGTGVPAFEPDGLNTIITYKMKK